MNAKRMGAAEGATMKETARKVEEVSGYVN